MTKLTIDKTFEELIQDIDFASDSDNETLRSAINELKNRFELAEKYNIDIEKNYSSNEVINILRIEQRTLYRYIDNWEIEAMKVWKRLWIISGINIIKFLYKQDEQKTCKDV